MNPNDHMNNQLNMLLNQMNQNNQMNQINMNLNPVENNSIKIDINSANLFNNKDPIKKLKFKNMSNNVIYNATISKYFTRNELYSLIGLYERNFILIYKDDILENIESNIDDIPDGTTIEIFNKTKEGYHKKHLYYHYLLDKYKNSFKINVIFIYSTGEKYTINFPSDISISQMIKVVKYEHELHGDICFICYGHRLKDNDNSKLSQNFKHSNVEITVVVPHELECGFHIKDIKAIILVKDKNIVKTTNVNRHNSIQSLISIIEKLIEAKIKKLYIEDKLMDLKDEKSIASLGIKDDFICTAEI